MSIESDITNAIERSTGTVAIIGDQFYWDCAPGSAFAPYLVAQVVSDEGETALDGTRDDEFPLIQFTAWAKTKAAAAALRSQLAKDIEGKNLPGSAKVSLGYAGRQSMRDEQTSLFGEIIEYRASALRN